MGSKSLFRNQNIDSHIYNQSSNFEDACSYDDFSGCLNTSTKYLKKVPTWPVFPQDSEYHCFSISSMANVNKFSLWQIMQMRH